MIVETIKKHPVATIGAVGVGVLLLIVLMSAGGSSASADPNSPSPDAALAAATSLQTAEIQAGTTLATAQLAYKSDLNHLTSDQNLLSLATSADLLKTYDNNDTTYKVSALDAGVQHHTIDAQTSVAIANYNHQDNIAAIGAGVDIAQINATRDTYLGSAAISSDAQRYVADVNARTTLGLARENTAINSANRKSENVKSGTGIIGSILGVAGKFLGIF